MQNYIKLFNKQNIKLHFSLKIVKIVYSFSNFFIIILCFHENVLKSMKFTLKIYVIFLTISLLWNISLILFPYFESLGNGWAEISYFGYSFFSSACHQVEERSFFMFGNPLPVCSRCSSVYFSFLLAVILYPFIKGLENKKLPPIWILLIVSLLVFLDAVLDIFGIFKNTFATRTISGALIGFVLPFYLIPGTLNFANEIRIKYFNF